MGYRWYLFVGVVKDVTLQRASELHFFLHHISYDQMPERTMRMLDWSFHWCWMTDEISNPKRCSGALLNFCELVRCLCWGDESCSCLWAVIANWRNRTVLSPGDFSLPWAAGRQWASWAEGSGSPWESAALILESWAFAVLFAGRQLARQLDCHGKDSVWPF